MTIILIDLRIEVEEEKRMSFPKRIDKKDKPSCTTCVACFSNSLYFLPPLSEASPHKCPPSCSARRVNSGNRFSPTTKTSNLQPRAAPIPRPQPTTHIVGQRQSPPTITTGTNSFPVSPMKSKRTAAGPYPNYHRRPADATRGRCRNTLPQFFLLLMTRIDLCRRRRRLRDRANRPREDIRPWRRSAHSTRSLSSRTGRKSGFCSSGKW